MADAQRTIDVVFNGVDKTGAAVQSALANTGSIASGVQSATQPFADAAAAAVKYEAALIAAGAAITAFSIKAASDFDSGFREIATLIDEPIVALASFRQEVLDYGADSAFSLEQVNTSVYNAISAGVDYTKSLAVVAEAERLAVAGKGDLDSTLKLLVSSLNAYGLETDSAAKFSDALFSTVKAGQTTLPELNASLQGVTTSAASLGVPFEEVLGALSALTSTGVPTSQAVTQINAVLSALLKPSSQAASLAASLGIEFSAAAVESKGLAGVLADVQSATGGSAEQMAILFSRQEAIKGSMSLTGEAAGAFAANLGNLQNSAGATAAAYEKLAGSFENATGRLSSSFEALGVAIGTPLLDDAGSVADALGEVLGVLGQSFTSGELSNLTQFVEGEFARFAEVLRGVSEALPAALSQSDLSGFTKGLQAIKEAVTSLFGGLDLTNAQDLARAIEFVGEAFNGLSQFSAGVIESFGPVLRYFAELAESASQGDEALRELGGAFGVASQINQFASALGGASTALQGLVGLMIANQGINLVKGLSGASAGVSALIPLLGKTGLVGAAGAAGLAIGNLYNKIAEIATGKSLSDWLVDVAANVTGLEKEQNRLVEGLDDTGLSADQAGKLIKQLDDEMASIGKTTGDVAYNLSTGLVEGIDESTQALKPFPDAMRDAEGKLAALSKTAKDSGGTFSVVKNEYASAVDPILDLRDASAELRAELAIAAVEAGGAIRVAEIEADAERAVAAFDALAVSAGDSADLIGELFGLLGDDNISKFDKLGIKKTIEEENAIRQKLLEKQLKLTSAEIRVANARARAFERGDAMITIKGDGLQPHLEAFMWEILEALQVRVNADGAEFLLGAGA